MVSKSWHSGLWPIGLSISAALLPMAPAYAVLGGPMPSVISDSAHLRATARRVTLPTHARHDLTLPNGGLVREYTNPQGQVFAVSWRGPGKPDLRALLGPHFADLQTANVRQARRGPRFARMPAAVSHDDIKIQTGGHMGYFWGVAYLPAMVPAGFNMNDLQ